MAILANGDPAVARDRFPSELARSAMPGYLLDLADAAAFKGQRSPSHLGAIAISSPTY